MKDLKLPILALAAGIIFTAAAAVPNTPQNPQKKVPAKARIALRGDKADVSLRPKAPSRQVVTCEYDGSYLTFGFVMPEGVCEATVTENVSGASQTYTFDSTPLTANVYVGELYESTVTMTTASGNTYTGSLTADPE